jgi:hypothetical protein
MMIILIQKKLWCDHQSEMNTGDKSDNNVSGVGPTSSYAARLQRSADRLQAKIYEKYNMEDTLVSSLRNSVPVVLTEETREKYGVYPYARREINGTKSIIHASPEGVDRTAKWIPQSGSFIDQMERTKKGLGVTWDWKPIPLSEPAKERDKGRQFYYEEALLKKIYQQQGVVYLHNPSNVTVWAAEKLNFKIVCDDQWRDMYEDSLSKMQVRNNVFSRHPGDYVIYMGPHGKGDWRFPAWCALTPNVYAKAEDGKPHLFYEHDDRMGFSYERRGRQVNGDIVYEPKWTRHNPASVDSLLGQTQQSFFLELNFELPVPSCEQTTSPILWLDTPPRGLEDDKTVWDVEGPGTYLSRRWRAKEYADSVGKELCGLSRVQGTCPVSLTTNKLVTGILHNYFGNLTQVPISGVGEVPNGQIVKVIHEQADRGHPLMVVPGLFFSDVKWDPTTRTIDWIGTSFFVVRDLRSAHNLQIDLMRFFFSNRWQRQIVLTDIVKSNPMPIPTLTEIHPAVDFVERHPVGERLPSLDLLKLSIKVGWGTKFLYHMLVRYENITMAPPRKVSLREYIEKETHVIKRDTSRQYLPQPGEMRNYIPVLWRRFLLHNGYREEAEALLTIRTTDQKVRTECKNLPAIIHYLNLPVRKGQDDQGIFFVRLSSMHCHTLDSILSGQRPNQVVWA